MKRRDVIQAVKFTLFSISAGLVQVASFALFHDVLHFSQYWLSYLPSLVLSVLWNFTFNRKFTFHSTSNVGRAMALVALYYLVFTPLSSWWGQLLSNAGVHDWLVEAINMLINFKKRGSRLFVLFNLGECILAQSAGGAYPILGDIFPGRAGCDTVVGIAFCRIIHIAARAFVFIHVCILLS